MISAAGNLMSTTDNLIRTTDDLISSTDNVIRTTDILRRRNDLLRVRLEGGFIDSFLILAPILLVTALLIFLFSYGLTLNSLSLSAKLVGRQIAREPQRPDLSALAEEAISREKIEVADFHVMRFPIGNQVFVQLVLIGRTKNFGWWTLTPSAKSLTLADQW